MIDSSSIGMLLLWVEQGDLFRLDVASGAYSVWIENSLAPCEATLTTAALSDSIASDFASD